MTKLSTGAADGSCVVVPKVTLLYRSYRVLEEELDVSLVAGVEEDGSAVRLPPRVVHQVLDLEHVIVGETEVVHLPNRQRTEVYPQIFPS